MPILFWTLNTRSMPSAGEVFLVADMQLWRRCAPKLVSGSGTRPEGLIKPVIGPLVKPEMGEEPA